MQVDASLVAAQLRLVAFVAAVVEILSAMRGDDCCHVGSIGRSSNRKNKPLMSMTSQRERAKANNRLTLGSRYQVSFGLASGTKPKPVIG